MVYYKTIVLHEFFKLPIEQQKALHKRRVDELLPIMVDNITNGKYFVIDNIRYNLYTDLVGNPIYSSIGD
jgi:hypothetical protein